MCLRTVSAFLFLALASCVRAQTVEVAATATPTPPPSAAPIVLPPPPPLTPATTAFLLSAKGTNLIFEFETGGRSEYNPHPEAPDARYSGVTWGIGYDAHQNSAAVIFTDWQRLGERPATRLAATQPYYGRSAQQHLRDVRDILVSWQDAVGVFTVVDVAREYANAKHAYSNFDGLRQNAQAALISLGFNRGWSFLGANRTEMRDIRDYGVPKQDYTRIAAQLRKMVRVWSGTEIYNGMRRRRLAEAQLVETP